MYICIEGCAHGDLDKIYARIEEHEVQNNKKVDLLICCGDFQAVRNTEDLACMAVPQKYLEMGTFYKYYKGEQIAPVLTILIGGNHEASNHLQELAYGGWVAPKIYYLGYAGVININGIKIGGISGIYRGYNYKKGHYEITPYDNNTVRTVYAMRNLEVFRLLQMTPSTIDIMLSHDWPQKIWEYGDQSKRYGHYQGLMKLKPHFKDDIDSGKLGNPPCMNLLKTLKPRFWYSAHMHCRFDAKVNHNEDEFTEFTALDKCLPLRQCFDFREIGDEPERDEDGVAKLNIQYDAEWLTILHLTNKFLNCTASDTNLPYKPPSSQSYENQPRWNYTPTKEEIEAVLKKFDNDLTLPENFKQTANSYDPDWDKITNLKMPKPSLNIQTQMFCEKLGIDDPLFIAANLNNVNLTIPNYSVSDKAAFKDCNIFSDDQSSFKKQQLSLPKPVSDDEIDLDELEDDDEKCKELSTKESEKEEQNIKEQSKEAIELKQPSNSEESEANELQPAAKKFKRRNQEIYNATDE